MSGKKAKRYNNVSLSFQGYEESLNVKRVPKSASYRENLVPLLDKPVVIKGRIGRLKRRKVQGRWINIFLLKEIEVLNLSETYETDHLWIFCEQGFLKRNNLKEGDIPILGGFFYEYKRYDNWNNPFRNIGFNLQKVLGKDKYITDDGRE
jgi:hypothetical protein